MSNVRYIGMDVHKDTIDIAVVNTMTRRGQTERETRIRNEAGAIKKFFEGLDESWIPMAGYEAGPAGFSLYRFVTGLNVQCVVIAPGSLVRRPADRVKTDRRDARMIAHSLKNGDVDRVAVPQPEDEATRDFLRARDDLREELKHYKQRLNQLLLRHGLHYTEGGNWTLGHRKWIQNLEFVIDCLKETVDIYYYRIVELEEKIRQMDADIEQIAQSEPYAERVGRLRCFRGIDYHVALAFVSEIGDYRRFGSAGSFMKFLGLVVDEYSTGSRRRQGSITKAGNAHLRRLLTEAAWHYRRKPAPSKRLNERRRGQPEQLIAYADRAARRLSTKFFRMVFRGKRSQVAVTAVARELAGFIWGAMVGQTEGANAD